MINFHKLIHLIFAPLTLVGLSDKNTFSTKTDECLKTINVTGKPLCLPYVDGLVECSNDSKVEFFSNLLKAENEITIAWYFKAKDCRSIDNKLSEGKFDYFKVWTMTQFVNRKNKKNDFIEFESYFKNNDWSFLFNWSIEEKVEKYINEEISNDSPILLEFYKPPNDNIFSTIYLMKNITGNTESIVISSTNIIKINDRTYFYALYLPYDGLTSIKSLKAKGDYFGLKLLSVNNE